jgi:hypothetical protein
MRGGVLVAVYAQDPAIKVFVVDWDDIQEGSTRANVPFPVESLDQMPAETKAAVGDRSTREKLFA